MAAIAPRRRRRAPPTVKALKFKEIDMPIIAWLLGVPLSVVLLLMLFGVF
ncbi:MAG: hypothetical protein KF695_05450 [Simplicispira sp.]|nr:hypothetical protein [Simplicispira sp.]